jgi:hypothetical protein
MLTPIVIGVPDGYGHLSLQQEVDQYMQMGHVPFASLDQVPAGGRVRVENLVNGVVREAPIPADGRFRVPIPADAMTAVEKRIATGMPDEGPGTEVWSLPDNAGLGDRLVVTVFDASGAEVARVDTFEADTVYEGVTYPAGSPLVAAAPGLGYRRGTPDLRRLVMSSALAMEPGDPVAYAPHWFLDPFDGQPKNILVQPTIGDQGVTISAGIALARAGGLVPMHEVDPRYGESVDRWLVDHQVLHGLEAFGPYVDGTGAPALFDPDDLDEGTDGTGAPSEEPLRITVDTSSGQSALRLSYPVTTGMHGFDTPDPSRPFDTALYVTGSVGAYFLSHGTEIRDQVCYGTDSCADLPPLAP